ncbi:MAG: tetratricopeptide repeat protein [Bacteroidetes bacterium]|nr:tetratricopeptide repeat protein [Bacteroidota bacterium]
MEENIIKPIDAMSDDELISILTIKKDNFHEDYREKVQVELNTRGIKLEDVLKVVEYNINLNEFEKVDVASAFEKTSLLKEPLDVIYFRNYMAEHLAIQKNARTFVLHHYDPKSGFSSFFLDDETMLKKSLIDFFSLGDWLPEGIEIIKHWDTFADSTSKAYILRLAHLLDDTGINYSINSTKLVRFSSFNSPYSIVLPMEDMDEAEGIMIEIEDLKNSLHEKLEAAEKNEDVDKQLEILTELESVTPEDSALFYNKAQLLDEKGDYQNASDALIESFNLDFSNDAVDDVEEIENYLIEMLKKVETKTNILHCLATISAFKGEIDDALAYYQKLVELDEKDPIAHLNLGHLLYSHSDDDEKVKFHFRKYMELEPEGAERESIEEILKNME